MTNVVINAAEIWQNAIDEAIEQYKDYLDFSVMPLEEFKAECLETVAYYFDNDMIGLDTNYKDVVSDTAKLYEIWRG